jgi:hypothetical protein
MTYTVEATVRRSGDTTRKIEWDFTGRGCGTQCWTFWKKMRQTNRTGDTDEPFVSAAIRRDGAIVESVGL